MTAATCATCAHYDPYEGAPDHGACRRVPATRSAGGWVPAQAVAFGACGHHEPWTARLPEGWRAKWNDGEAVVLRGDGRDCALVRNGAIKVWGDVTADAMRALLAFYRRGAR